MAGVPLREMTAERWQATIATDLTGAFLVSRRFLKGRGESTDPASLIHISSIHAEVVRAGGADYCAATGGLTKLVQTLAIPEAARGIRVHAIRSRESRVGTEGVRWCRYQWRPGKSHKKK